MKKCLIIGASSESIHSITKVKQEGVYVIAIDGNKEASGLKYADEPHVLDIRNFEEVDKALEKIGPDFTLTVPIGRYLVTTGHVNEKWNLKGITYENAKTSVDKYLFHNKLHSEGLREINMALINQDTNVCSINMNWPCIAKPRYGSGSRDIYYFVDEKEFVKKYDEIVDKNEDFLLEDFVKGEEYSVDGAVIDGKLYITLLRKKIMTELPNRQAVAYISVTKNEEEKELYSKVQVVMEKAIKVLGYTDCLLQNDLLINENDVFIIEMAPRPTGHYIHDIFEPEVTGIDLAQEYVKYILGKEYSFENPSIKKMEIKYFDFCNVRVKGIPDEKELRKKYGIVKWHCNIKENDYMEKVINGHSVMGRGYFIVEAKNDEQLIEQCNKIMSEFILEY